MHERLLKATAMEQSGHLFLHISTNDLSSEEIARLLINLTT